MSLTSLQIPGELVLLALPESAAHTPGQQGKAQCRTAKTVITSLSFSEGDKGEITSNEKWDIKLSALGKEFACNAGNPGSISG